MAQKTNNEIAQEWFSRNELTAYDFQAQTWEAVRKGYSGILNAPTGFGKTYALWFGILQNYFDKHRKQRGLHALWITPLRALSQEIFRQTNLVSDELGLDYDIALRTGDTSASEKARQIKNLPHALISTPESVHLMMAQKGYSERLKNVQIVVVDEWHELAGSKRGVQIELALSRLKRLNPNLMVWGISATIGNLEEAGNVLLSCISGKKTIIRSKKKKQISLRTLIPEQPEKYSWGGHLGIKMVGEVLRVIEENHSTLVFTNTRSQCEIWYRRLLEAQPDLAGLLAIHHGSLSEEVRLWVEQSLHDGKLKAVVCTSALDLGVDFRPVDAVIQIGSPKGVARFMQRAGRAGHQPEAVSNVWFLPTHSLETIEGSALRQAMATNNIESRMPYVRCFDVLIQYLVTLAISEGFLPDIIYEEIQSTHCYASVTREEFEGCLQFIVHGGSTLTNYEEYHKVVIEDGVYKVTSKQVAMRHRLNIGTIVSDGMMQVKYLNGARIGSIEEWFITRLKPGDAFFFAGRNLELVRVKEMEAFVQRSTKNKGVFPSWEGGRMPLSSNLTDTIREKIDSRKNAGADEEVKRLIPLFEEQRKRSHVPHKNELLIERIQSREGYHLYIYPFAGRNVHEGLAMLLAFRIGKIKPVSFSISRNDYGFELLSESPIPLEAALEAGLFDDSTLAADITESVNITEMARRRFREIAHIAGLVFGGFPGKKIKTRHLQANSQLFFSVFRDHEPGNLLLRQAFDEVMTFEMEEARLRKALQTMQTQQIVIKDMKYFSPFSFPILTERFREKFTNEKLEDRLNKIIAAMKD